MRRLGLLLSVLVCLGVFFAAATEARAVLVPCCEGGFKPNKRCDTNADCPDICRGGFRDGKPCSTSPCLSACVGGTKDGKNCEDDFNCPGGSCSNTGVCIESTCTAMCEKRGPKSPSDPVSDWLPMSLELDDRQLVSRPACP